MFREKIAFINRIDPPGEGDPGKILAKIDRQPAAGKIEAHRRCNPVAQPGDDRRRHRSGAAGEGFAFDPALPGARPEMVGIDALDEIDIGPLREEGVMAEKRPVPGHVDRCGLWHKEHVMGHPGVDKASRNKALTGGGIELEIDAGRRDHPCCHLQPLGLGIIEPAVDLHGELCTTDAKMAGKPGDGPAAVAAHPGDATVGVDMDIAEIGALTRLEKNHAVCSDAQVMPANPAEKERITVCRPSPGAIVNEDEIVAGRGNLDKMQPQFISPIIDCFL